MNYLRPGKFSVPVASEKVSQADWDAIFCRKAEPMIRQGDVLLIRRKAAPATAKPHSTLTIAFGEATGHHHTVINGEVLVDEQGALFVVAKEATALRHQTESGAVADHLPLTLPTGTYEVRIEEDYTPEGLRRVAD